MPQIRLLLTTVHVHELYLLTNLLTNYTSANLVLACEWDVFNRLQNVKQWASGEQRCTVSTEVQRWRTVLAFRCHSWIHTHLHQPIRWSIDPQFLPMRRRASGVQAMALCLSLVRLAQAGIVSKKMHESSWFWHGGFLPPIVHCVKNLGNTKNEGTQQDDCVVKETCGQSSLLLTCRGCMGNAVILTMHIVQSVWHGIYNIV